MDKYTDLKKYHPRLTESILVRNVIRLPNITEDLPATAYIVHMKDKLNELFKYWL